MRTLLGHDKTVADWVIAKIGKPIVEPYTAIGWLGPDGTLKAGAVFNDYNGSNIEVTVYGHRGLTRQTFKETMRYAFGQLKCNRLTARTERKNKRMHRILTKMEKRGFGFKFEGVATRFFGPHKHNDALVYRILRTDAERWLT